MHLRADPQALRWIAEYKHEVMGLALPADIPARYSQNSCSRTFHLSDWEAALEHVLEWLWTKHALIMGKPRPTTAFVNEDNRAVLAAFIDNLPPDRKRYKKR